MQKIGQAVQGLNPLAYTNWMQVTQVNTIFRIIRTIFDGPLVFALKSLLCVIPTENHGNALEFPTKNYLKHSPHFSIFSHSLPYLYSQDC